MEKLTWATERRKISDLKEFSKNPRKMTKEQFHHLTTSIEKFDYVELVTVDTDNTIIAGHMRVKALKKLKRNKELIEVRVPSRKLTEEEFEEYLVRSNLNTGSFDYDILANEFEPLDLLKYGFSEEQLLGTCKEAEQILKDEEEKNSSKKVKECPRCGHEF